MSDAPPLFDRIQAAAAAVRSRAAMTPDLAIILGTGLGGLGREITVKAEIPYGDIPGFVKSTVESHAGKLLLGTLEGRSVVAMSGRFHRYEGYSMAEITFPVRVMRALGAQTLVVSNIAGGVNRHFAPGDLMVIEDHLNLMGDNPLIGPHDERLGGRWPDLCRCYDPSLHRMVLDLGRAAGLRMQTGVYAAMTGPSLETAAEYRMLERIGADAIGMSTVPEVLVARHGGMRVLGVSVITDVCVADALQPADVGEIIRIATETEPGLTKLMRAAIATMGKT
ncbi:MAG: purine-nucleoside phosphorylase [Candidatus Coatesbacteria bacterium]